MRLNGDLRGDSVTDLRITRCFLTFPALEARIFPIILSCLNGSWRGHLRELIIGHIDASGYRRVALLGVYGALKILVQFCWPLIPAV